MKDLLGQAYPNQSLSQAQVWFSRRWIFHLIDFLWHKPYNPQPLDLPSDATPFSILILSSHLIIKQGKEVCLQNKGQSWNFANSLNSPEASQKSMQDKISFVCNLILSCMYRIFKPNIMKNLILPRNKTLLRVLKTTKNWKTRCHSTDGIRLTQFLPSALNLSTLCGARLCKQTL